MPKQKWNTGKQYCAEPETDPYAQIYRKSDIFLDYMNESSCKIPRIEEFSADPSTELLETIECIDLPAHRLTGKVRCQYLKYLEGLLEGNYSAWSGSVEPYENVTFSSDEIKRCAERIEMKAVQSCMIASLYRKYILKTISQIRKETNECSIHPNLVDSKFAPKIIKKECSHVSVQTDELDLETCTKVRSITMDDLQPKEQASTKEADLKKSLWPCEYHMQKMKLRELLSNIADTNYFKYERIRLRFIELFGEYEEEEDELGPYSPSIELNEVLISSCRQRIAQWVVQSLMKPLNEGLIGNRFLFKKLAKHLADGIIYANQYPNQRYIKNYIVEYFCTHPAILSVEDMY
ncbi:hypothetical protein pipiens_012924 [Culex pipiens pipiens]|uniref:Uncharacterized protein n=1 Tax=Culex pipiens pipiens TaxID=38569 RepID=A0ABD1D1L0_CULPP